MIGVADTPFPMQRKRRLIANACDICLKKKRKRKRILRLALYYEEPGCKCCRKNGSTSGQNAGSLSELLWPSESTIKCG